MTVLVVTHAGDEHCTPRVLQALRARGGACFRLDTDRYPAEVTLSVALSPAGGESVLRDGDRALRLGEVTAVYHRRDETARGLPTDMDPALRGHSVAEARRVLRGCLEALPCFHLDPPDRASRGRNKQWQLELATRCGLEVPRTLITNDPAAARAFVEGCERGAVAKMMNAVSVWDADGAEHALFTSEVTADDLGALDGLSLCPMTFQEKLPKALELRVTVVGREVYAAAVDSQSSARATVDWRREGLGLIASWRHHALPAAVRDGALRLMDALGLNYGAFDFVLTPDGRTVFLEVNPEGEFFWLEDSPGLPLSDAIAGVLLGQTARR